MENYNFEYIIFDLILTITAYMIFPLVYKLFHKGEISEKTTKIISLVNSIIVGLLFFIIKEALNIGHVATTGGPAFLYYYVNKSILSWKNADRAVSIMLLVISILCFISSLFVVFVIFLPLAIIALSAFIWACIKNSKKKKKNKIKKDVELEELEKKIDKYEISTKTIYCKKCGGKLNKDKKCTKCGKQYFNIKNKSLLFVIPLTILLISSIVLNVKFYNEKQALFEVGETFYEANVDLEKEYDTLEEKYNKLGAKYSKIEEKAEFLDENIVFVLEGYGNKYYTYDCVQEITDGEYSYWAFNIDAAKSQGYKKGTCN